MSRKKAEDQYIKRMANLLRQGSTLTQLACPACSSPLFRFKNQDLWCVKCEKKVIVVREGEDPNQVTSSILMNKLEATLIAKVQKLQNKLEHEENVDEVQKLSRVTSELLENLEKIKKIKRLG